MANIYKTLLNEKDETKLLVTQLKGKQGLIQEALRREMISETQKNTSLEEVQKTGKPMLIKAQEAFLYIEPFYPKERLIILGGGHIAEPLVEVGALLNFKVTVIDDRPSFAYKQRFPKAQQVICEDFVKALKELHLTPRDYIVIVTRGHRHDTDCLREVLSQTETIYVGMIGSKRRVAAVKDLLKEEGYEEGRLERVCTPIGLSIGAVTPEEISISIMAQIIARKRGQYSQSDLDLEIIETLAESPKKSMGIVTVIHTKGSVPRGVGAKMLVYPDGQIVGSIGGGCSEAIAIQKARCLIGTKSYAIETIDLTGAVAEEEGMVCGGKMEILIEDYIAERA